MRLKVCAARCAVVVVGWFLVVPAFADYERLSAEIRKRSTELFKQTVAWRRDIHQHPELSNREFRTSKLVARHLKSLDGIEVQTGVAHTGVVGVLRGGQADSSTPVVALRADMDALPVTERTGLPFASTVKGEYQGKEVGVMHACGHDTHVAILMAAAQVLSELADDLPGTVKFVFQPAEEGPPKGEEGGAKMMIQEGVLTDPDVDAIFGLHIGQQVPAGVAIYRPRGAMASAQRFDIEIEGKQTHGARPWAGVDPIIVGAQIVTALQTIVSRNVDVTRAPAVVTVGQFEAGVRNNIVPDRAKLSGTIRTFDADVRADIHERIEAIATSIGESMGARVAVQIDPGVPVTHNDPELTNRMLPTLETVYGRDNVLLSERITGAEDFSFYQEVVPGFFFFIGGRPPSVPPSEMVPNHSPFFDVDEAALLPAVRAMSQLAVDYLTSRR